MEYILYNISIWCYRYLHFFLHISYISDAWFQNMNMWNWNIEEALKVEDEQQPSDLNLMVLDALPEKNLKNMRLCFSNSSFFFG